MKDRSELVLSAAIALLAVPVHLAGLFAPGLYRDPAALLPQNLGTDLVTLSIGIPLLVVGAIASRGGSLRGRLVWLGALGYLAYAYGMYALGVRWNPLFLAYLTLFGLSFFALTTGLVRTDAARIRDAAHGRAPARSVAAYLIGIAVMVAALWLGEEVGAVLHGTVPPSVVQFEAPTNIVHVFDLGIVLPAFVLAAVMLLRDRPWGYVLAGVLLVKASTIGVWVAVMIWLSAQRGFGSPAAYTAFFLALTLGGIVLSWLYVAGIDDRGSVKGVVGRRLSVPADDR